MNPDEATPQRQLFDQDSPQIESTVTCSKNGRYLIHRTVITHIKPAAYYEAILRTATDRRKEAT